MIAEKISKKGFVISLDTLFAIAILIALISYIGLGIRPEAPTADITRQVNAKQMLDDAITAMDNNGIIGKVFVDETGEPVTSLDANKIYFEIKKILPENMDLNIRVEQYEQKSDLTECKITKKFSDCFTNASAATGGNTIPADKEIYTGNQVFMKRQPYLKGNIANKCIVEGDLAGKKNQTLKFDETSIITTKVSASNNAAIPEFFDETKTLYCYDPNDETNKDNQVATVTISEKSGIRNPIAVMAIIDRSGSMSKLDMQKQLNSGPPPVFNSGQCLPNPPGTCTTNCGNYTNWLTTVGSYTLSSATKSRMSMSADEFVVANRYYSGSGYACSNAKIRTKNPSGVYRYNNSTDISTANQYSRTRKNSADLVTGAWTVDLWADAQTQITKPVWAGINFALRDATNTQSTVPGDGGNCPTGNPSVWHQIGYVDIPSSTTDVYSLTVNVNHDYASPEGNGVRIEITGPGSITYYGTQSKNSPASAYAGKPEENPFDAISAPFTPQYLATGTYYIWACSDRDISIVGNIQYKYSVLLSKIEPLTIWGYSYPPNSYPTIQYNNGKCSGVACTACSSPDTTTAVILKSLNVSRNIRSLSVHVYAASYDGTCNYPLFNLLAPTGASITMNGQTPITNRCISVNKSVYDPNSCTGSATISTPIPQGNWDFRGWSNDIIEGYTVDWNWQRIDVAIEAAETFINNEQWKNEDAMGIVSYSSTAVLNQSPVLLTEGGKTSLINILSGTDSFGYDPQKTFNPGGETNIGDAIETATNALAGQSNKKFIVLLSDGQANKPDPATAVTYAIGKANNARNAGITVYTIGFGADVAAEDMRDIAKDPCTSYDAAGNCLGARMDGPNPKYPECFPSWPSIEETADLCGRYYFASDQSTLTEIYELIAEEIGTAVPDTKIIIEAEPGTEICKCEKYENYECKNSDESNACYANDPNWTSQSIIFDVDIAGEYTSQRFKERIPCTGEYCQSNTVKFPPPQTTIIKDQNNFIWGVNTTCDSSCLPGCTYDLETCRQTVNFGYRNCQIKFTGGTVTSPNNSTVNFDLNCTGFNSPKDLYVGFYNNSTLTEKITATMPSPACIGADCGTAQIVTGGLQDGNVEYSPNTSKPNYTVSINNTNLSGAGYIWGVINGVNDCSRNNISRIYCLSESKIYYFKVQYAAWVK